MKSKLLSLLFVATLVFSAFAVMPVSVAEAAPSAQVGGFTGIPVVGDLLDEVGGILTGAFDGTLDITGFSREGGQLIAEGLLNGTITDALGNVTEVTDFAVELPLDLDESGGSCDILNLVLGPLDLNILGLRIELNQVLLDITAVPGGGNLLGNLLCAVTHLLDGPGNPLGAIANLLNRILGILG